MRATGTNSLDDWPGSGRDGFGYLVEAAGRGGRWRDGDAGGRAGNAGEGAEVAGLLESGRGTAAVDADKDGDDAEVQKHDGTDGEHGSHGVYGFVGLVFTGWKNLRVRAGQGPGRRARRRGRARRSRGTCQG